MRSRAFLLFALLAVAAPFAHALIVAGLPVTDNTTAPGNGAPWNYVGAVNGASGVYLGNYDGGYWVITADHVGLGNITLPGGSYTAVSGSGVQIGSADLFAYQISTDPGLPNLTLAATAPGAGLSVTLIGNGHVGGAAQVYWSVDTTGNPNGDLTVPPWTWTSQGSNSSGANFSGYDWDSGTAMRWGTNTITGSTTYNGTSLLYTTFDAVSGEAQGATGDSGGGVFYKNGSTWELAGIMDYVGSYNNQPSSTAIFGDLTEFANIAVYQTAIFSAIPEPADIAAWCGALAIGFAFWRRRRRA